MEINNKIINNWLKLIYLHLYKDTFLIVMQAHKQSQPFIQYSKNLINEKINFSKLKLFTISKVRDSIKSKL